MNRVIDSHTHLDDIRDLKEALGRAEEAGVIAIVTVGVNGDSNRKALDICRNYGSLEGLPAIFPSLGIHPGDVIGLDFEKAFKFIEENVESAAAVSEIGLDYWYKEARGDESVRLLQDKIYTKLLDLASRREKPVVIHSRGAWRDCFEKAVGSGIRKAAFHWYSGPEDVLEDILDAGYYISASPSLEYSPEHRRAVKRAPLERLLLETDSPVYFKPASGKYRSEPKDVNRALRAAAGLKGVSEAEAAMKTTDNAIRFFDLPL